MKESPDVGVFIKDLTVNVVRSVAEMDKYMAIGNSSRSTGETAMNKDSSRSHSIFTIFIECSVNIIAINIFRFRMIREIQESQLVNLI